MNVQAEQIADEMEFTDFQKKLHMTQLEDAYKQNLPAVMGFELMSIEEVPAAKGEG